MMLGDEKGLFMITIKNIFFDIVSFFIGAALTLAFAPYSFFITAIVAPAILLALWLPVSPWRAFFRGGFFGIGFFGTGVHWVFFSIHTYGNAPIWLASLITIIFVLLLALFPAICGYVLQRYFSQSNDTKILFAFPAIWTFSEWIRSWLFSGFPWLLLGNSQLATPLKGYATLFSVYGVSFTVLLSSGLLVLLMIKVIQKKYPILFIYLFTLISIWIIGFVSASLSWTTPQGKPFLVSLVQGNIPESVKWSDDQLAPTLERYTQLTQPLWEKSKMIIWPESAIPIAKQDAEDFLNSLDMTAKKNHVAFITGIPIRDDDSNNYYNAVIVLGDGTGAYEKQHLVPFGEYVPLAYFFQKILNVFHIPMSNFISSQKSSSPLEMHSIKMATFVCYEIAFPEQVFHQAKNTHVLLNVSNDGWFGNSIAPAQHVEIAQMRALETGRPALLVSNNGITAFIGPNGKIQSEAPAYQATVLTHLLQPVKGTTPWLRFGMDPILLILLIALGIAIKKQRPQGEKK